MGPRWLKYKEIPPNFADTKVKANKLLEHIATTKDASDYLWYTTNFDHKPTKDQPVLHVLTLGHVVHAFVNNVYGGSEHGFFGAHNVSLQKPILLNYGANNVTLLSVMVGLPNSGAFLESRISGIREVKIQGTNQGGRNFSNDEWGYQVGLLGEKLQIYTEDGIGKVAWSSIGSPSPLTWYKTVFDAPPPGDDPVVLNLDSMEKGEAWVNGQSIGRYWSSFRTPKGTPSQTLYHIPRSFLKPSDNLLVLLEEYGGNPLNVSLDVINTNRICGHVSASHPPPFNTWGLIKRTSGGEHKSHREPKIELACPSGMSVSNIVFASYGNPLGNCSNYSVGTCHSLNSRTVVEKACLGKMRCSITQSSRNFGGDPCPKISKSLLVDAQCG